LSIKEAKKTPNQTTYRGLGNPLPTSSGAQAHLSLEALQSSRKRDWKVQWLGGSAWGTPASNGPMLLGVQQPNRGATSHLTCTAIKMTLNENFSSSVTLATLNHLLLIIFPGRLQVFNKGCWPDASSMSSYASYVCIVCFMFPKMVISPPVMDLFKEEQCSSRKELERV
jgi:hypothetical protein